MINKLSSVAQEIWAWINKHLKVSWRNFLLKKVIDNLIAYSLYFLLLASILYLVIQLGYKIFKNFLSFSASDTFPFVLEFAEYLFLYSLPIFIVFGFINFYELQWKRQINQTNKPNPEAKESLTLSKKLFFSSLLSYLSLKLIDILFFKFNADYSIVRLIAIGLFFILIAIIVIVQNKHH